MPIVHLVATAALVAVLFGTLRDAWLLSRGRPGRHESRMGRLTLAALSLVVFWQAAIWLRTGHPEASAAYHLLVWLQLAASGLLAIVAAALGWRHRTPRASGIT